MPVKTILRAAAFKDGLAPSEVANGGYKIYKYDNGLYGEYFANTTLSGDPVLTRGDQQINQNYGSARWDAAVPSGNFSARWTGRLRPPFSGTYQLHTVTDDGVRLWIDNNLVIDNWTVQPRTTNTANTTLNGGQDYELRMEYFDASGGDKIAILMWTPPGRTMQLIPTARLYPPVSPSGTNLLIAAGTTWKYLAPPSAGGGGWGWVAMDSVTIPGTLLVAPVAPELTIQRWSSNQVRIAWPAAAAGFSLQRSAVADSGYADPGLPVFMEGDDCAAYDTIGTGGMFYRLVRYELIDGIWFLTPRDSLAV